MTGKRSRVNIVIFLIVLLGIVHLPLSSSFKMIASGNVFFPVCLSIKEVTRGCTLMGDDNVPIPTLDGRTAFCTIYKEHVTVSKWITSRN